MPTYEYECTQGCNFEIQQSIKDDALARCPKASCPKGKGGVKVRRLLSAPSFILKGGGWYSDGYSSGGKPAKESGTSPSSAKETGSAKESKSGDGAAKTSDSGKSSTPASD